jgi:PAS domain S-box-containing protein
MMSSPLSPFPSAGRPSAIDSRTEPRFRLIFDQAPLGILLVEARTGRILRANPCFAKLLGRSTTELEGLDWMSITHPDDMEANRLGRDRLNTGEISTYRAIKRYLRSDGDTVWVNMITSRVEVDEGAQPRNLTIVEDITERQKAERQIQNLTARLEAEQRLRISEQRYRDLNASLERRVAERTDQLKQAITALRESEQSLKFVLDGGRLGTWDWDLETGVIKRNAYWAEMLGYQLTEIDEGTSETCRRLMHPDDLERACRALEDHLAGRNPRYEVEFRLRAADGNYRWILDRGRVVSRDPAGLPLRVSGTHEDVSRQKQGEAEMRQARLVAEQANAAKTEFLARMSHEIRTPLYSILGLAHMIQRQPLSPHQEDMLGRIQAAGQSLMGILNDILDLAKIESGHLRIETRPFDLGELLAKLAGVFGPLARAEGVELRIEYPSPPLGKLRGDDLRLEQVLTNLIGNAIKFTERGEITLQLHLLAATPTAVRLRFRVSDTGIGISPETLAGLFTPFTQGEGGNTRRFGGTGLGLAISKRLVELMGGEIGAESQPGRGSTFWFELPLERSAVFGTAMAAASPSLDPVKPDLTGMRFLVVDDCAEHRDLMAQALIAERASVIQAGDGAQAVEYLRRHPDACDLVLMDLQMPVIDGFTATRQIREELDLIMLPVIALTAGVLPEQRRAALAAGVDEILTKPVDLDQIATRLWPWVQHLAPETPPLAEAATAQALMSPPRQDTHVPKRTVEPFPDIAGINPLTAAKVLGGDLDLFQRLLRGFARDFADLATAIRADLDQGLRDGAVQRLHKLNGRCGYIGATDILSKARALEEAVRAGETDLGHRLADLQARIRALIAASSPWIGTGS